MGGTVNGTVAVPIVPGAIAVAMTPWPPWFTYGAPFRRILYETAVPAGIVVTPRLSTVVWTCTTDPPSPAFGRFGSSATRFVYPFCTALWASERIDGSRFQRAWPGPSVWPPFWPTIECESGLP